jgi:hypothetical protein
VTLRINVLTSSFLSLAPKPAVPEFTQSQTPYLHDTQLEIQGESLDQMQRRGIATVVLTIAKGCKLAKVTRSQAIMMAWSLGKPLEPMASHSHSCEDWPQRCASVRLAQTRLLA